MDDLLVILVVEDDQQIQSIIEQALPEAGFESLIAASGEEAATLLQSNMTGFRAVVTDVDLWTAGPSPDRLGSSIRPFLSST